jgi:SAM-dependent methyltransferase
VLRRAAPRPSLPTSHLAEVNVVDHAFRREVLARHGVEYDDFDRRYFDEPTATGFGGYHADGNGAEGSRDFAEEARRIAAVPGVRSVLDVGCAKGFLVGELRSLGVEAFGIDVSSYAISCAEPRVRPWLAVRSLRDLGARERYDLCHVCGVLVYLGLSEIRAALRALHRVTRIGGVFWEPSLDSLLSLYARRDLGAVDPLRKQELPSEVWEALYREAGFEAAAGGGWHRRFPARRALVGRRDPERVGSASASLR